MSTQSYLKEQHAKAKAEGLVLITIGFNDQHAGGRAGKCMAFGPVSPKFFKKVQNLFVEFADKEKRLAK